MIDIRKPPRMVKVGDDMRRTDSGHTSVLLPEYGLLFDARPPGMADSHAAAERIAGELGDGWALPELSELLLIVDRSRKAPAINTEYFPHTPTNDWYWTATPHASSPSDLAWGVAFYYGGVSYNHRHCSGFVRAVKRLSAEQVADIMGESE
jgi:hypothetical protein